MIIEISAKIEGHFEFNSPTKEIWFKRRRYLLYKEGSVYYIAFRVDVDDPKEYYPKDVYDNTNFFTKFEQHDVYNEAIELFQYVESAGATIFNVEKIHWEQPRITLIPQTIEEKEKYHTLTQSKVRLRNGEKKAVTWDNLSEIVIYRDKFEPYNLPFSFYREGNLAFQKGENRRAFLMYYMMLEFLFAEGETRHSETKKKFSQSEILTRAISSMIEDLKVPELNLHLAWLQDKCKNYNKKIDVDGFYHILVKMRGMLAHGMKNSSEYIFNDKELRTLTLLTSCVAFKVCGMLKIDSFSSKDRR